MIVKLATIFVLVGVSFALPVEDPTHHVPQIKLIEPVFSTTPTKLEASAKPTSPDTSDLKPEASNWWHSSHSWYHHDIPIYPVYHVKYVASVPHYSYWHSHW